ncbi:hypothetical protein C7S13_6816 [Burkholderia cepacia]|nr:hypothetical protein [Burkholderia cepacia]
MHHGDLQGKRIIFIVAINFLMDRLETLVGRGWVSMLSIV